MNSVSNEVYDIAHEMVSLTEGIRDKDYNKSNIQSTKTITYMIADNAVYIKKEKSKNGIIVFFTDMYVCTMSTTKDVDGCPVILLLRENTGGLVVYEKWLHTVAKMIKKDYESKYFVQPLTIHFNNGAFTNNIVDEVKLSAIQMKRLFISKNL